MHLCMFISVIAGVFVFVTVIIVVVVQIKTITHDHNGMWIINVKQQKSYTYTLHI